MRAAFLVSALLHFAIIAAAIISLPDSDGFTTAPVVALPVELVSIEEVTDLTAGDVRETEVVEDAAEATVETELDAQPDEMPGATGEEADVVATDEDARVNADLSSSPDPAAEPEPADAPTEEPAEAPEPVEAAAPEPEPVQEPAPAETDFAALEPAPAPQTEAPPEPKRPETVVPNRKPTPPPRRTQEARRQEAAPDAFDAQRLSQLINRTDPSGGGTGAGNASLGTSDGRSGATLTLSEMDALRAQMQQCWNPPIGLAGAEYMVVTVQIRLLPDGAVDSIIDVGNGVGALYDTASDSARRAVIQCQPYRLPPQKYDAWKDVQVTFDPRQLF